MSPDISDDPVPENPFWRFSLRVYARDDVKRSCLALQDEMGADVNILLFLCWRASKGMTRPSGDELAAMVSAIEPVNREVIHPLRQVRRRLASLPLGGARGARGLVLKAELAGEQMAQALLYKRFGMEPKARQSPAPDAARDALAQYLNLLDQAAARRQNADASADQLVRAIFANA